MKHFIIFLFVYIFVSCTNNGKVKQNNTDTIYVSGQTSLVAHLDTIELLWEPTSNVRCSPIRIIKKTKRCYALDLKELNKSCIKKIRGIKIKNSYFQCVPFYDKDSILNVTYIKKYNTYINLKLLDEIKDKYKIIRIDYRNRKLFYETMYYFENHYGKANLYSTSEKGNPINRELANFVIWNLKTQTIILEDIPTENCIYPPTGKRQIQIILKQKE